MSIENEGGQIPNTEFPPGYSPSEEADNLLKGQQGLPETENSTHVTEYENQLFESYRIELDSCSQNVYDTLLGSESTAEVHHDDPRYKEVFDKTISEIRGTLGIYGQNSNKRELGN